MNTSAVLPPGTILQLMYLRERLRRLQRGRFVEIGPGAGQITRLLLNLGWRGVSYSPDPVTADTLLRRFEGEIRQGYLQVKAQNFVACAPEERVDLVISSMVMEHLDEAEEAIFIRKSLGLLIVGGLMITIVPGSPKDWGVEDEVAGHFRRYTRGALADLAARHGAHVEHMAGLTFPLSNMLLPVSNALVRRKEGGNLELSMAERTKLSGQRRVKYKTFFPSVMRVFLNYYTMLPLHFLQKILSGSERALVLYVEMSAARATVASPLGGVPR